MIVVQLAPAERSRAIEIGRRRQAENLGLGRRDSYGACFTPEQGLLLHILGALGEAATAAWCGVWWDGNLGNLRAADVGHLQARTTAHRDGRLILHPPPRFSNESGDKSEDAFVHVRALGDSRFELVGWVWGHEGQLRCYWWDPGNGRPAYFVSNAILRPMPTVPLYPTF